jgi:hypothetical protein
VIGFMRVGLDDYVYRVNTVVKNIVTRFKQGEEIYMEISNEFTNSVRT